MKLKITRSKLLDGLKTVQNVVPNKGALQIIQNVLLETRENQLFMTTTDLDISVKCVVPCETVEEGSTTLPVKLLASTIFKAAEGVIEIETDSKSRSSISAGSAFFRLQGMDTIDFPKLPADTNNYEYTLPQPVLRDMLRKTSYATTQDDTRKTLRGVLMAFKDGKVTMVATDGRRLALIEHEIECPKEAEKEVVLPPKVVSELLRTLSDSGDVRISAEANRISFTLGDTKIWSKLMAEVYPNYKPVIPTDCIETVVVDRKLLLDAVERVNVMSILESSSVKFIFEANELTLCSNSNNFDNGEAKDIVPIKYAGERIEVNLNPNYVLDPLKAIDDDEVRIELTSSNRAILMKCSIPFVYVMMALRVN